MNLFDKARLGMMNLQDTIAFRQAVKQRRVSVQKSVQKTVFVENCYGLNQTSSLAGNYGDCVVQVPEMHRAAKIGLTVAATSAFGVPGFMATTIATRLGKNK